MAEFKDSLISGFEANLQRLNVLDRLVNTVTCKAELLKPLLDDFQQLRNMVNELVKCQTAAVSAFQAEIKSCMAALPVNENGLLNEVVTLIARTKSLSHESSHLKSSLEHEFLAKSEIENQNLQLKDQLISISSQLHSNLQRISQFHISLPEPDFSFIEARLESLLALQNRLSHAALNNHLNWQSKYSSLRNECNQLQMTQNATSTALKNSNIALQQLQRELEDSRGRIRQLESALSTKNQEYRAKTIECERLLMELEIAKRVPKIPEPVGYQPSFSSGSFQSLSDPPKGKLICVIIDCLFL